LGGAGGGGVRGGGKGCKQSAMGGPGQPRIGTEQHVRPWAGEGVCVKMLSFLCLYPARSFWTLPMQDHDLPAPLHSHSRCRTMTCLPLYTLNGNRLQLLVGDYLGRRTRPRRGSRRPSASAGSSAGPHHFEDAAAAAATATAGRMYRGSVPPREPGEVGSPQAGVDGMDGPVQGQGTPHWAAIASNTNNEWSLHPGLPVGLLQPCPRAPGSWTEGLGSSRQQGRAGQHQLHSRMAEQLPDIASLHQVCRAAQHLVHEGPNHVRSCPLWVAWSAGRAVSVHPACLHVGPLPENSGQDERGRAGQHTLTASHANAHILQRHQGIKSAATGGRGEHELPTPVQLADRDPVLPWFSSSRHRPRILVGTRLEKLFDGESAGCGADNLGQEASLCCGLLSRSGCLTSLGRLLPRRSGRAAA